MQTLLLLTLLFVARFVSGDNICAVYDEQGNILGSDPHFMGTFPKDIKPGNVLPGRLLLKNFRAPTLKSGTCNPDYFKPVITSNWLRFEVTEKFRREGMNSDGCVLVLQMDKSEVCSDLLATEFRVKYLVREEIHAPVFTKENYTFQMSFPVSKGTTINEEDVTVMDLNFSEIRLELYDPFDGIEIVRLDPSTDQMHRFKLKTTKLLYLLEDLKSMLVAKTEHGEITSTVPFTLRMNEDSAVPKAEFEKSFYDVSVQASQLNPSANIYPAGMVKLKERYSNLNLNIRTLNDPELYFEVSHVKDARDVDIRLMELPKTNLTSRDIFLQLGARLTNAFGRESEAFTFILIRVIGNPECVNSSQVENKEQLAMIILSVIVAILLLVIIYLYFKYVRARKSPESSAEKTSTPSAVKHRRPTPGIISEYPYPLGKSQHESRGVDANGDYYYLPAEKLPKPMATLAETEEDSKGGVSNQRKFVQVKIVSDEGSAKAKRISTRKRSVTFVDSDMESRQNREAVEATSEERRLSEENQRRSSREQEERRRRKSSAKMYRCLT